MSLPSCHACEARQADPRWSGLLYPCCGATFWQCDGCGGRVTGEQWDAICARHQCAPSASDLHSLAAHSSRVTDTDVAAATLAASGDMRLALTLALRRAERAESDAALQHAQAVDMRRQLTEALERLASLRSAAQEAARALQSFNGLDGEHDDDGGGPCSDSCRVCAAFDGSEVALSSLAAQGVAP